MKTSKILVSAISTAAIIGAIGISNAQVPPATGRPSDVNKENDATTPATTPANRTGAMGFDRMAPAAEKPMENGVVPTTTSTNKSNRNMNRSDNTTDAKRTGAMGNSTNSSGGYSNDNNNMSNERPAKADRN